VVCFLTVGFKLEPYRIVICLLTVGSNWYHIEWWSVYWRF
jgi:hypothetical protein